jgi:hypothetical protein
MNRQHDLLPTHTDMVQDRVARGILATAISWYSEGLAVYTGYPALERSMKTQKFLGWGALGLGLATLVTGGLGLYEQNLEQPAYAVVEKDGAFELRDYPALLVAETAVIGERSGALNVGFKRLAGYIFGNKQEKIAMTTPVFSDGATAAWRTRFVMPKRFTTATLPDMPEGVTAAELPARRMAAVRFTGLISDAQLAEQEARLRGWLKARGLDATGDALTAIYNSPFVAPPFRRNEVMIAVG